jgi:hypothetical protein
MRISIPLDLSSRPLSLDLTFSSHNKQQVTRPHCHRYNAYPQGGRFGGFLKHVKMGNVE